MLKEALYYEKYDEKCCAYVAFVSWNIFKIRVYLVLVIIIMNDF